MRKRLIKIPSPLFVQTRQIQVYYEYCNNNIVTIILEPVHKILLRLLFNWCRSVCHAIDGRTPRASSFRLGQIGLRILGIVIVVLVNIHMASSRLMMLRTFLLGRLRHARRRRSTHRRKRRWVVCSLRRVVAIVESSRVWSFLRALTRHLR